MKERAPRSQVGLSDLLRLQAHLGAEDAAIAKLVGYRVEAVAAAIEAERDLFPIEPVDVDVAGSSESVDLPQGRAPMPMLRVVERHSQEPEQDRTRPEVEPLRVPTSYEPGRGLNRVPASLPEASWAQIEPRVQELLDAVVRTRAVDEPRLVRDIARGEVLESIPRLERTTWPRRLEVWVDRSARMAPLHIDHGAMIAGLKGLMPKGAVIERRVRSVGLLRDMRITPGAQVLVLGDLGLCGDPSERESWRRFGEGVLRAGGRGAALVPQRRADVSAGLRSVWKVASWRDAVVADAEVVRDLLRLLSPLPLAPPGLVRELRKGLGASVLAELQAFGSDDVHLQGSLGLAVAPEAARALLGELRGLDEATRCALGEVVRRWYARLPMQLVRAQALSWSWVQDCAAEEVVRYGWQVVETVLRGGAGAYAYLEVAWELIEAMPEAVYDHPELREVVRALLAVGGEGRTVDELPDNVDLAAEREKLGCDRSPVREVWLRQVGDRVVFAPKEGWEPPRIPGTRLAALRVRERVFVDGEPHPVTAQVTVERGRAVEISTGLDRVRLVWDWPSWAEATGCDRYGMWADMVLGEARQRFRWIGPGAFMMGSPESERGRDRDERQRCVTLTRGYWLADTPVTQALWREVTGDNPSRFQTDDRPVERVTWHDAVAFCERLAGRVPDLQPRLPSEAEWEYACRADTNTAIWTGDLDIVGQRNAPSLDAIAWYGGNSGVDLDLPDARAHRSGWNEMQVASSHSASRAVRQKHANPWGLYDMLGNVYEWCLDAWKEELSMEDVIDPCVQGGAYRGVRGGSWYGYARFVRAAYRDGRPPAYRSDDLGLRLAGGPAPGRGAPASAVERPSRSQDATPAPRSGVDDAGAT